MEYRYEIWDMECEKPVQGRFTSESVKGTIKINVRFSGSAGGQMGGWWHRTSRRMRDLLWKRE
jgi:hypothetical protein